MTDFLFEAQLERAARLYSEEAVRPIDAATMAEWAIDAAGRDREDRRLASRWIRAWVLIAVALLITVVLAAAVFVGGRLLAVVVPPSPSTIPSASPLASLTPPPSPIDQSAAGTWLADIPANVTFNGGATATRMTLNVDSGLTATVDLVDGAGGFLRSSMLTFGIGDIQFTTAATVPGESVSVDGTALAGCVAGDEGHYKSSVSQAGLVLALAVVTESCPSRQAVLARTWTRSISVPNGGGVGVVDAFDPLFTVVLPTGTYVVDQGADSTTIRQNFPEFQFESFKDPQGFKDPCDRSKGRYELSAGADALVAYFRQLAGFTVDSTRETRVDGHRAVRIVLHANAGASCPDGLLWEWQPKAERTDAGWFLRPGVTDSLFIVELPSATVMFEVLPAPNSLEDEVIGSIHFVDRLPTQP